MKAVVQDKYGSPDVLELRDIDKPVAADGEVLVAVQAAGVNIGDWHVLRGKPYPLRLAGFGVMKPKNGVRGINVAGTVEAVGENVSALEAGDEVFGWCEAGFAEYVCAEADHFLPKPANLSFDQAAVLGDSALTALQALRDHGKLQQGQKVLINGASGGVGTFAVQIAKSYGAHVTGVCSTRNVEMVRSIGADEVIDYTREDFTQPGERYDVMLDLVGSRSLAECRGALVARGTYVLVGVADPGAIGVGRQAKMFFSSPFLRKKQRFFVVKATRDDLIFLNELAQAGKLTPVIDRRFQLGEAPEALRYQGEGHSRGKIVITA